MAAVRWLLWWGVVVVMVNVGERRVVCCGGDHVRFLGLGHMVNDVVENGKNRNKKSNCSNMIVLCEDL